MPPLALRLLAGPRFERLCERAQTQTTTLLRDPTSSRSACDLWSSSSAEEGAITQHPRSEPGAPRNHRNQSDNHEAAQSSGSLARKPSLEVLLRALGERLRRSKSLDVLCVGRSRAVRARGNVGAAILSGSDGSDCRYITDMQLRHRRRFMDTSAGDMYTAVTDARVVGDQCGRIPCSMQGTRRDPEVTRMVKHWHQRGRGSNTPPVVRDPRIRLQNRRRTGPRP